MNENTVELRILKFEGPNALLALDEQNIFTWPLNKLPSKLKEGENIKFKILTQDAVDSEHEIIARKLLEEMIN